MNFWRNSILTEKQLIRFWIDSDGEFCSAFPFYNSDDFSDEPDLNIVYQFEVGE